MEYTFGLMQVAYIERDGKRTIVGPRGTAGVCECRNIEEAEEWVDRYVLVCSSPSGITDVDWSRVCVQANMQINAFKNGKSAVDPWKRRCAAGAGSMRMRQKEIEAKGSKQFRALRECVTWDECIKRARSYASVKVAYGRASLWYAHCNDTASNMRKRYARKTGERYESKPTV